MNTCKMVGGGGRQGRGSQAAAQAVGLQVGGGGRQGRGREAAAQAGVITMLVEVLLEKLCQ